MNCSQCNYKHISWGANTRGNCYCNHPNQDYIRNYYKEHDISRAEGFICFTKPLTKELSIKTSPKWCPLKEETE